MFEWIKKMFFKCYNNRVLRYIFYGGLATLVNLGVYNLLRSAVPGMPYMAASVLSIAAAIVFAYFTNSRFVFCSNSRGLKQRFPEFVKFFTARLSTLVIEVGGQALLVEQAHMNDRWAKFLIQFIVLALNYVFSKFLIFTRKNTSGKAADTEKQNTSR